MRPFAANSVDLGCVRYFSFSVPKAKPFTMDFYKYMNFVNFPIINRFEEENWT